MALCGRRAFHYCLVAFRQRHRMTTTSSAGVRPYWPTNGLAALLDLAAYAHQRALAFLVVVSLLFFLPGFFQIPPVDRDEAYFAQATKQMIETGDYVDIRYQDDVRYRKPIGIYWLQAAVVNLAEALGLRAARTTIWLYRVPSLFGAIGAVLATYWCALAFVARRGAVVAALMMSGSLLLNVEARLAKTDAVLLFTVVVAMGVLARAYLPRRENGDALAGPLSWPLATVFWTALAAGILDKGPLILMVVGLAAIIASIIGRSALWLKALRPLAGIIWLFVLVLPWLVAIYLRTGTAFLVDSVGHDMLAKVSGARETHGAPPGLYVLLFFVTFFPSSVLALLAAPAIWTSRREPAAYFLLAWLVPSWIVFELVPTKLPHYVLPLYPAIAILVAGAIEGKVLSRRAWLSRLTIWWFIVPILFSVAAVACTITFDRDLRLTAWPFLAAAIVCGLFAWRLYEVDGVEQSFMRTTAAALLAGAGIAGIVLPSLTPAFPSAALAGVLKKTACPFPIAASSGYEEPSLVFLAGTATQLMDPAGMADFLLRGGCRFAFIEARQERSFALRAEAIGLRYKAGPRIEGYNIANGQRIAVAVFQPADTP
jgi:4-amino-4-deoxy-L-arabinose transferase-like glycosyltransferase